MGWAKSRRRSGGYGRSGKPSERPSDVVFAALESALSVGIGWADFWKLTPYATRRIIRGEIERRRAQSELTITGAFYSAYFGRFKTLGPADLQKALGRKTKPTAQQSDEQIGANIFDWLKTTEAINEHRSGH